MNAKEFFIKVVEVRNAQKTYFKDRSNVNLQNAKRLERELDDEIRSVQKQRSEPDIPILLY